MPTRTTTVKRTVLKGRISVPRSRLGGMFKRRSGLRRGLMVRAPTFTETIVRPVKISSNAGDVFKVSMDEIPQLSQYSNLYRQYKINWAKITLLPDTNSYNGTETFQNAGMPRMAWAINDTPAVPAPASESDLLQDNGAKVKPFLSKWGASFKPLANLAMTDATTSAVIPVTRRGTQYLNFQGAGHNPQHYGISYWISQALAGGATASSYTVIVKINFSLRDPQ